jgi:predicted TIM-barrel fold metal-dependent hydrolase
VREHGFKMMKLHANMHAYRPDRALDWLRPALRVCDDLGLVVLLHTGDGPYSIPTQYYKIIREFPSVNFIIGHFGVQTGGVYCFEALYMILDSPNVYGESGWLLQSRIVEFAQDMPKEKLVYGTDSPPNEPGMWMRELEVLCSDPPQGFNLGEDDLEGYLGNNTARLLGLEPTPPPRSFDEAAAYLERTSGLRVDARPAFVHG